MPLAADAAHPALLHRRQARDGAEQPEALVEAVGGHGRGGAHPGQQRPRVRGVGDDRAAGRGTGRGRAPSSSSRPTGRATAGGAVPVSPYRAATSVTTRAAAEAHPQAGGGRVVGAPDHLLQLREVRPARGQISPVRARCRMSSATKSLTIEAVGNGRSRRPPLSAAYAGARAHAASAAPGGHPATGPAAGPRPPPGCRPARIGGDDRGRPAPRPAGPGPSAAAGPAGREQRRRPGQHEQRSGARRAPGGARGRPVRRRHRRPWPHGPPPRRPCFRFHATGVCRFRSCAPVRCGACQPSS